VSLPIRPAPLRRPFSLRAALLLFMLAPLALLGTIAGMYGLGGLERQVEARMQEDIELVARAIRLPLSHALERDRAGSVQQALDSAFRIDHVYGAYVYDDRGELIASSGPRSPSVASRSEARAVTATGSHGEYAERGGHEVFSYFVTLTDSAGRISGLLQVTRDGADIQAYLGTIRSRALSLLVLLVLTASLLVVIGHHRAVGRHFRRLEAATNRIRGGERARRMPLAGPREVRALAGQVNAMLDAIDRSQAELDRHRREQQRLESRLRESEKLAAVGRLAAGVAHELGTPLSVIGGHAQRAQRRGGNSESGTALTAIRCEVGRMERIVRQLLDFGRTNKLRTAPEAADRIARTATARALTGVGSQVDPARVGVHGPSPAPMLEVDRTRLEQALENLVANALQAATDARVRVSWFAGETGAGFTIDDDGPGVAAADRSRIFEPFFTTKPVGEGTGLGLAVAHGAVADHGGAILLEDSPLGGARFRICLPRPGPGR